MCTFRETRAPRNNPGGANRASQVFEPLRTVKSLLGPMWPVDAAAQYAFVEEAAAAARL
jgi:hypothetical protein